MKTTRPKILDILVDKYKAIQTCAVLKRATKSERAFLDCGAMFPKTLPLPKLLEIRQLLTSLKAPAILYVMGGHPVLTWMMYPEKRAMKKKVVAK